MGVLNITPDSFSDGGFFLRLDDAVQHARLMVEQGANVIDVGGESTRPGADDVSVNEELQRVIPVIEALRNAVDVPISVDTSKVEVMQAAVAAGAAMVNDVRALSAQGAVEFVAQSGVDVCLMHMQGQNSRTMQLKPRYADVVFEVKSYLKERVGRCVEAGVDKSKIYVDPGFGFGKSLEHNMSLFKALAEFKGLGRLLVGVSRKSMLGKITGRDVDGRLPASLALAALAEWFEVDMLRVHDVKETLDVIKTIDAVKSAQ